MQQSTNPSEFRYKYELANERNFSVQKLSKAFKEIGVVFPRGQLPPMCVYFTYLKLGFPPKQDSAIWHKAFAHLTHEKIEQEIYKKYGTKNDETNRNPPK